MKKIFRLVAPLALMTPLMAAAQTGINVSYLQGYSNNITGVINYVLVPVLMAIAFIVFLWGVYKYFILGAADEKNRTDGRQFTLWGVIGFVVILSLWGIVNIFMSTLGLSVGQAPPYPTIGNIGGSQNTTGSPTFGTTGNQTVGGGASTNTDAQKQALALWAYQTCTMNNTPTSPNSVNCQTVYQQYGGTGSAATLSGAQASYDACIAQGSSVTDCQAIKQQYIQDNSGGTGANAGYGSGTASCTPPEVQSPEGGCYTPVSSGNGTQSYVTCWDGSNAVDQASCPPNTPGTCYDDNGNSYPC